MLVVVHFEGIYDQTKYIRLKRDNPIDTNIKQVITVLRARKHSTYKTSYISYMRYDTCFDSPGMVITTYGSNLGNHI